MTDTRVTITCDCTINDICKQGRFGHAPQCTILVEPNTIWNALKDVAVEYAYTRTKRAERMKS